MSILPSHKQGLYYLEHCRIMAKDERVVYAKKEEAFTKFFSIPPANTNVILLGSGTSITQAAARILSDEGVLVGFTGGGGTPLYLASQSEYRPTRYLQDWLSFWWDNPKRLAAAKLFQHARCRFLFKSHKILDGPKPEPEIISEAIRDYRTRIDLAEDPQQLMGYEANFAKKLYAAWAATLEVSGFERKSGKKDLGDRFNAYLDHGNYLAYGLAATVLWVLGIPHALPVSHGMTRRGALVFDVADLIKDGAIMPIAFQSAALKAPDNKMRQGCTAFLDRTGALVFMFEIIQQTIEKLK